MKVFRRVLWILMGCLFVSGTIIGIVGFAMVDFQPQKIEGNDTTLKSYDIKMDPAKTEDIVIDVYSRAVTIQFTDDDNFFITYDENENRPLIIREDGEKLEIIQEQKRHWYDYITIWDFYQETTNLLIPKAFTGNLTIKTTNGTIQVMDGKILDNMGKLDCRTSNGGIELHDLSNVGEIYGETSNHHIYVETVTSTGNVVLQTSNGALNVSNLTTKGELSAKSSNGNLSVEQTQAKNCDLTTSNAVLSLDKLTVKDTVTAKTSNALLSIYHLAGNEISLTTSNGRIDGDILGKMDDYRIESHTSNGSNALPENKTTGTKSLKADTSNADININFAE